MSNPGGREELIERLHGALSALEANNEDEFRKQIGAIADLRASPVMLALARLARELGETLGSLNVADPLFEPERTPRHFEVNDQPATVMEVQSFGRGVGREQQAAACAELALHGIALDRRHASVQQQRPVVRTRVTQPCQRVPILGEHDGGLIQPAEQP